MIHKRDLPPNERTNKVETEKDRETQRDRDRQIER